MSSSNFFMFSICFLPKFLFTLIGQKFRPQEFFEKKVLRCKIEKNEFCHFSKSGANFKFSCRVLNGRN